MDDHRSRALFESTLRPRLADLEARRKALQRRIVLAGALLLMTIGSAVNAFDPPVWLLRMPYGDFSHVALGALAIVCLGLFFAKGVVPGLTAHVNYRTRFKKEVVAEILRATRPAGTRHFPDRHLSREAFDRSDLFELRNGNFKGDDLVQGFAGETPYSCSEIDMSYSTGGKNSRTVVVFRGLLVRFELDVELAGRTLVLPSGESPGSAAGRLSPVPLDPSFDDVFGVWSTSPQEAAAVLGEDTRRRLVELRENLGRPLRLSLAGARGMAAVSQSAGLFEPGIWKGLDAAAVAQMAALLAVPEDVIGAFGLRSGRRRPPDPGFHGEEVTVGGLEAVTAKGEVGLEQLIDASDDAREAAQPASLPPGKTPWSRVSADGVGLTVEYPVGLALMLVLAIFLALTPLVAALAASWADPGLRTLLHSIVADRAPEARDVAEIVFGFPAAAFLSGLFLWWMFAGTLQHRPARVTVGPEGVRIRRIFRPWSLELPFEVIRKVDASNQYVSFVRSDRSFLRSFVNGSPVLSLPEARWLAGELRRAMAQCGWRPPAKS
ncbi:MAG: DUF3137 domain-containing protein [Vicinamibacteria bacterium]